MVIVEPLTLGDLREGTKEMSDDTVIYFLHREDPMTDEGRDLHYMPTILWRSIEGADEEAITLVSVIEPEIIVEGEMDDEIDEEDSPYSNTIN